MPNTLDSSYLETSVYKRDIFANKVIFVTGGAGTICRVQTEAMVLLGANACIVGRNEEKTVRAAKEISELRKGAKVIGIGNVDVSKIETLVEAVTQTVSQLGGIDFVVAGAAGNFLASVGGLSPRAFARVVEIDLIGSFNTAKACLDQLTARRGHLLFVSATLQYKGLPLQAHASAAKAGIDSLVKTLALELGPLGVQVNGIAPGPIQGTEGLDRLMPEDIRERNRELVPLQVYGATRDIADSTVYLFSPAARFVSGHVLVVDGAAWFNSGAEMAHYPKFVVEMNKVNRL